MAVTSAVSDLFKSFYELVLSIFGTAYHVAHSIFFAIFNFVAGIFKLAGDILEGFADVAGGLGKFIAGNLVLILLVGLGVFGYMRYTAQGRQLATGKKTN